MATPEPAPSFRGEGQISLGLRSGRDRARFWDPARFSVASLRGGEHAGSARRTSALPRRRRSARGGTDGLLGALDPCCVAPRRRKMRMKIVGMRQAEEFFDRLFEFASIDKFESDHHAFGIKGPHSQDSLP